MGSSEEEKAWPPWLQSLLRAAFFVPCRSHLGSSSRNECNMYCLDCSNGALCSSCILHHHDHRVIQIRRSSYHDVIRVSEIQKHLDISGVQTYIINGARIVFLNERLQPRNAKVSAYMCYNCRRGLLDAFAFCSLGCKLAKTSPGIADCSWKPVPCESKLVKVGEQLKAKSGFGYQDELGLQGISPQTPPLNIVGSGVKKRRKGIPHRAPMGAC